MAKLIRATTWGRPYGGRFEMWISPGSRKTPTQCVLWERGGAGHKVNLRGRAAE